MTKLVANIPSGPFREGVEKNDANVIREMYTRLSMRDGQLVEETHTRHWNAGTYIDSSTVSPLLKETK